MARDGVKTKGIAFIVDWIREQEKGNFAPKGVDKADLERALCRERWGMSCNRCEKSTDTIKRAIKGGFIMRKEDGRLYLLRYGELETKRKLSRRERYEAPEPDAWGKLFRYTKKISAVHYKLMAIGDKMKSTENPVPGPVCVKALNARPSSSERINHPSRGERAKLQRNLPILKGIFSGYLFIDIEDKLLPTIEDYIEGEGLCYIASRMRKIDFLLGEVVLYLEDPKKYESDGEHDAEFLRRQNRIRVRTWAAKWIMKIAELMGEEESKKYKLLDFYCYMSDPGMAIEADLEQCKEMMDEDEIRAQEEWAAKGFKSRVDYLLAKNKEQDERLNKERQDEEHDEEHDEGEDIF